MSVVVLYLVAEIDSQVYHSEATIDIIVSRQILYSMCIYYFILWSLYWIVYVCVFRMFIKQTRRIFHLIFARFRFVSFVLCSVALSKTIQINSLMCLYASVCNMFVLFYAVIHLIIYFTVFGVFFLFVLSLRVLHVLVLHLLQSTKKWFLLCAQNPPAHACKICRYFVAGGKSTNRRRISTWKILFILPDVTDGKRDEIY